jgi:hypothetical protein
LTQEEQDIVIGRSIRELRGVKEQLAKLQEVATQISQIFVAMGHNLSRGAEFVRFDGESIDARFVRKPESWELAYVPKIAEFDIARVAALAADRRRLIIERDRLEQSLKEMGYER